MPKKAALLSRLLGCRLELPVCPLDLQHFSNLGIGCSTCFNAPSLPQTVQPRTCQCHLLTGRGENRHVFLIKHSKTLRSQKVPTLILLVISCLSVSVSLYFCHFCYFKLQNNCILNYKRYYIINKRKA